MKITTTLLKFLTREASQKNLDKLDNWVKKQKNETTLKSFSELNLLINMTMVQSDTETTKSRVLEKIRKNKRADKRRKVLNILKYAALVVAVLSITLFLRYRNTGLAQEVLTQTPLDDLQKKESISLKLADGTVELLDEKTSSFIHSNNGEQLGIQKGESLLYQGGVNQKELAYHKLTVPFGKKFNLTLSDGTKVKLNSGSSITYPVKFESNAERKVFLSGEAYFDVFHDASSTFSVYTDDLQISVLGTVFNVQNYPEKQNINTVLVEGSIVLNAVGTSVNDLKSSVVMVPNTLSQSDKKSYTTTINDVDVSVHLAWINDKLIFRNTNFKQIRTALERQFNIVIKNENKILDNQIFDATFDTESVSEILETLNKSFAIDYEIIENEVIIKTIN